MDRRQIKFTSEQWVLVNSLADAVGGSASEFVREACAQRVRALGHEWPGNLKQGEKSLHVNPHIAPGPSVTMLQDIVDRLSIRAQVVKARGGEQNHLGYALDFGERQEWLGETFVRAANALRARYGEWNED